MKPIKLEIAGLQSYREKVAIDFEQLCQGGVFGIFGPTGSGKSSILDAMTLALYGKVERAPGGTQGIMNALENKLSVALTFELAGAGERFRYRVERQYRRAGETAAHGALCRLIELAPEGDKVLADKASEVDAAVRKLIGLQMADFTRAVVLPQGKFAEFLTLAGKDRRQMLQRLFRLEKYGDHLAARLSARVDAVRVALKEVEAEQVGLGDASPEALQEALDRYREAKEAADGLRARLVRAEAEHEAMSRRLERQRELRRVEAQLTELEAMAPAIAEKEALLEKLKQAERVSPAIRDANEARQQLEAGRSALEAAQRGRETSRAQAETAAAAWMAAQEEATAREPELILRLERMAQAVKLEQEAAEWAEKRAALTSELAATTERQAAAERAHAEESDRLQRAKAKQTQLRQQWEALAPEAEASGRLRQAAGRKEQAEAAAQLAAETGRESADWQRKLESARLRRQTADGRLREALRLGEWLRRRAEAAAGQLQQLSGRVSGLAERLGAAAAKDAIAHTAAKLAVALTPGEPCPVCGSAHHPLPAAPAGGGDEGGPAVVWAGLQRSLDAASRELAAWQDTSAWRANRLRARLAETDALRARPEGTAAEAADFASLPGAAEAAEAAGSGGLTADDAAAATVDAPELAAFPADAAAPDVWQAAIRQLEQTLAAWKRRQLQDAADELERWESELASARREAELAAEAETSLAGHAALSSEKLGRQREQADKLRQTWQAEFAELDYALIEKLAETAAEAEREARSLRERLDKSVDFVAELDQAIRTLEGERHALALRAADAGARLEAAAASGEAVLSRLREWTDGQPASGLLARAERERRELQARLAAAKAAHEAAQQASQAAEAALTTAAERKSAGEAQSERAERRLAEVLAAFGFAAAEDVEPYLTRAGETLKLAEEIDGYKRSREQLTGQARLLRETMTGEPVEEADWQRSADELAALKTGQEEAAAAAARSERDAEDVASRRGRWEQLETRRAGLAADSARLAQLQAVFRGNAFVEYVAEEQLEQVCRVASERLGYLTRRRYALEVDAGGGFVIRDDANGGLRRPVTTLSGGETFLTSLALALALSAQIQLRGRYPLQFFFLDEGFGTLDPELLDTVVTSLEKLQQDELAVGIISHVPELQARLPRKLVVTPAEPGGRGSRIDYDTL